MLITLENKDFLAQIETFGAELRTFVKKKEGINFLWCADSSVWGKTSPVLFPCIGVIKDGKITHDGATYPMTRHGFARDHEFSLDSKTDSQAVLKLSDSEATRKLYPFSFDFYVTYTLTEHRLETAFRVVNRGDKTMYFALGGHTAFSTELCGATMSDYSLVFDEPTEFVSERVWTDRDKAGLLGAPKEVFPSGHNLPLKAEMFDADALIMLAFAPKSVQLMCAKHPYAVRVDYEKFPNLAVWAAKGTDRFVCIEPWIAHNDADRAPYELKEKDGFVALDHDCVFEATLIYSIQTRA